MPERDPQAAIERLEAIHTAATEPPWKSGPDESDPRGDRSDWLINGPERVIIRQSRSWFWNDPPRKDVADTDLIISARNSLPALLRCARALMEIRDKYESGEPVTGVKAIVDAALAELAKGEK